MLSIPSEAASPEASLRMALSRAMDKSISAAKMCHLLRTVHKSSPDLQPVMQELAHLGKEHCGAGSCQASRLLVSLLRETGNDLCQSSSLP